MTESIFLYDNIGSDEFINKVLEYSNTESFHAIYLESPNCSTIEHPGNDHMIALSLRDKGKLKEIIDGVIEPIISINF